ncbi:STAS-like domain-containing protein [uncultured Bacteroides sp.]|uniref:STAS-like domain-containing protein n=1 Tax=uncultured Bacteroides sp. TaxID=162156 RepID=UPI002AAB381C|nr:DUF4325 domain-containing protein [uncultured Bacteroides sp.]
MENLILMSELIGVELRSRTEAKKVLHHINSMARNNVVIDFKNITSMSRSFADEFCGIIENTRLTRSVSLVNKSKTIKIILDIVSRNRNKPKHISNTGETKEFSDIDSLCDFLAKI